MSKKYILAISLKQPEHEFWGNLTDEEYVAELKAHLRNFPHEVTWLNTVDDLEDAFVRKLPTDFEFNTVSIVIDPVYEEAKINEQD